MQMQSQKFEAFKLISVIDFLSAFKLACGTDGSHDGAAMCLFQIFMTGSSTATLNARLYLKQTSSSNSSIEKEGMLRLHPEVVRLLFQTDATNDGIAETDAALWRYTLSSILSPTQCVEALKNKFLACGKV